MTIEEVKQARKAQTENVLLREQLDQLKMVDPVPYMIRHFGPPQNIESCLEKHRRKIDALTEQLEANQRTIDAVLQQAESVPAEIRDILRLRILDLREWSDISKILCRSGTPNTSYMRLFRYLDRTEAS